MRTPLSTLSYIVGHPLASRRPAHAVARYFWWQASSRRRAEIEWEWMAGAKLVARRGMTGATGNIYCGLHEFYEMGFLLHLLRADDLFVDVGANVGSYTVLAAAVCGARAIAVEPDPGSLTALKRNLRANAIEARVECVEAAAGASVGVVRFTSGRDTMNHVAAAVDGPAREVALTTLDALVAGRRPALIKIDVEGYEAEVLAGASATLASEDLLAVMTESASKDVHARLESAGFQRRRYDPFARAWRAAEGKASPYALNSLFVRDADAVMARLCAAPLRTAAGVAV